MSVEFGVEGGRSIVTIYQMRLVHLTRLTALFELSSSTPSKLHSRVVRLCWPGPSMYSACSRVPSEATRHIWQVWKGCRIPVCPAWRRPPVAQAALATPSKVSYKGCHGLTSVLQLCSSTGGGCCVGERVSPRYKVSCLIPLDISSIASHHITSQPQPPAKTPPLAHSSLSARFSTF